MEILTKCSCLVIKSHLYVIIVVSLNTSNHWCLIHVSDEYFLAFFLQLIKHFIKCYQLQSNFVTSVISCYLLLQSNLIIFYFSQILLSFTSVKSCFLLLQSNLVIFKYSQILLSLTSQILLSFISVKSCYLELQSNLFILNYMQLFLSFTSVKSHYLELQSTFVILNYSQFLLS